MLSGCMESVIKYVSCLIHLRVHDMSVVVEIMEGLGDGLEWFALETVRMRFHCKKNSIFGVLFLS